MRCCLQRQPMVWLRECPVSLPISRIGPEIVDAAVKSAEQKRAVKLA